MSPRDDRRCFTPRQARQLLIAANCKCQRCGIDLTGQPFEAHHIRPYAAGGPTQLYNGMALCLRCHRQIKEGRMFQPRKWQQDCLERFQKELADGNNSYVFEACMGAGKSSEAAWLAKVLLEEHDVDHVLALVPWRSIQGDVDKGMLGAFGEMGLDARDRFFTASKRQPRQPRPQMDATITLYQEVCCEEAIDTIRMWQAGGFRFALICDEIHHTNEFNSSWGTYVEELRQLADYSIFMSGTYFRSDKKPISCVPLASDGTPIKHYRYPYAAGVRDNVVRAVTTRDINAKVLLYDRAKDKKYEVDLSAISPKELAEAKKQVLDPNGECIRHMIEQVDLALTQARFKFPDAACLFVCRPGGGDNFTAEGNEAQEDRNVHIIAKQIKDLTGHEATVVTYHDRDALGKIARFRRSGDRYLVAVNMISEGCDIPRLRAVAFCRYTTSEMLFRQIVGRALRLHAPEDGTAAQIYIPAFPLLVEFARRLYSEAQEGIKDRRCKKCGEWPCACPCPVCGEPKSQCKCYIPGPPPPLVPPDILGINATPILDGGYVGDEHVQEPYVVAATHIAAATEALRHSNPTQLGYALQRFMSMQQQQQPAGPGSGSPAGPSPGQERERLIRQITRNVRRLAIRLHNKDFGAAYTQEIIKPFGSPMLVIQNTWGVDKLRQVADRLERRIMEVFRDA